MYYFTTYPSPVGLLTLAGTEDSLAGLWLEGQKYFLGTLPEAPARNDHAAIFQQTAVWLDRYFSGDRPAVCDLPLAPIGGGFRQRIWKLLCEIPYGEVTTYGDLSKKAAAQMGKKRMSPQAVGGAVGHNPISIIIPCHRVVGTNGSLTGYAGGIDKKLWLLKHEGASLEALFCP